MTQAKFTWLTKAQTPRNLIWGLHTSSFGKSYIVTDEANIYGFGFGEPREYQNAFPRDDAKTRSQYEALLALYEKTQMSTPVSFTVNGTAFQHSVWQALLDVSWGNTASYQDIAIIIGNPKAARAVGQAVGKNPISLIIPCHRIISQDGGIGGYAWGPSLKKKLLEFEKSSP